MKKYSILCLSPKVKYNLQEKFSNMSVTEFAMLLKTLYKKRRGKQNKALIMVLMKFNQTFIILKNPTNPKNDDLASASQKQP